MIIGRSLRREEDPRPLTGSACHAADVRPPDAPHAVIVRSRWARAAIRGADGVRQDGEPGRRTPAPVRGFVRHAGGCVPVSTVGRAAQIPGRVIEEVELAPRDRLAREMSRGQVLRVVDLQGQQVGDLIAFNRRDLDEKFWISTTVRLNKTVYVTRGHVLYSELSRPMFRIVEDTCGRHDLLAGSCNAEIDKVRYDVDGHEGCVENFLAVLAPYGLRRKDVPMSLNLFMNCPVRPDGFWEIAEPVSKAGDFIDLRAEMDLLFALSNCPQDLNPCNAGNPLKPLRVVIYDPAA